MSRPNKRIQKNLNVDNINAKIINWNHELSFRDKKVFPGGQFTLDGSLNEVTGFNTHNPGDKKFYMWDHTNTDEGDKAAIFTQYNYIGINTEPDQGMIGNRRQPTLDLGVDGQIRIGHPPLIPGLKDVPYSINNNANDPFGELYAQGIELWEAPTGTIVYSNEGAGGNLFYRDGGTWYRLLAANDQIPDISTNWAINNTSNTIFIKKDTAGESRERTNRLSLGLKYADSKRIFLVLNSVPVRVPPIIPPKPKTPDLSDITHISLSNLYSFLSRASKVSPFLEFLTIISLSILSAS